MNKQDAAVVLSELESIEEAVLIASKDYNNAADLARALRGIAYLKQSLAQPQEDPDVPDAIRLLGLLFDGWENGHPCYTDPDNEGEYLGSAFRISDELFDECCNLLNRRNPPRGTVLENGMLIGAQPQAPVVPEGYWLAPKTLPNS